MLTAETQLLQSNIDMSDPGSLTVLYDLCDLLAPILMPQIILQKILKMLNIFISHYGRYVVLNKVTLQAVSILYYVCFLLGVKKYLLIPRV